MLAVYSRAAAIAAVAATAQVSRSDIMRDAELW